jgi:hypothetical protein
MLLILPIRPELLEILRRDGLLGRGLVDTEDIPYGSSTLHLEITSQWLSSVKLG